jgi:hypothetical protein
MDQIFNFERFLKYVRYDWIKNGKTYLSWVGGVFMFFILIFFPILSLSGVLSHNIYSYHGLMYFLLGLVLIGFSFKEFQSKDSTTVSLMLPVTSFEKLLFFFFFKYLLFLIFFSFAYYLSVSIYLIIASYLNVMFSFTITELNDMYFQVLTLRNFIDNYIFQPKSNYKTINYYQIFTMIALITSLIPFRVRSQKYSVLRWLIHCVSLFLIFILFSKFVDPFSKSILMLNSNLLIILISITLILFWVYSYYLLKEKQV